MSKITTSKILFDSKWGNYSSKQFLLLTFRTFGTSIIHQVYFIICSLLFHIYNYKSSDSSPVDILPEYYCITAGIYKLKTKRLISISIFARVGLRGQA